jgi:hypothetical protein
MVELAQIDMTDVSVTPVFKYIELENVPQSDIKGCEVRRSLEVVEIHTAGSRNSIPVFPVDAQWRRDGNRVITYAERWPEQYRAFKEGGPQEALGTPLEMLREHGIKPEHISLCRAHRIYSIEALHNLSHDGIKALGIHANTLRGAATQFMAGRDGFARVQAENEELRARLARLEGMVTPPVAEPPSHDPAPSDITTMGDGEIKDEIERLAGARPRGNPGRDTLERLLNEARSQA